MHAGLSARNGDSQGRRWGLSGAPAQRWSSGPEGLGAAGARPLGLKGHGCLHQGWLLSCSDKAPTGLSQPKPVAPATGRARGAGCDGPAGGAHLVRERPQTDEQECPREEKTSKGQERRPQVWREKEGADCAGQTRRPVRGRAHREPCTPGPQSTEQRACDRPAEACGPPWAPPGDPGSSLTPRFLSSEAGPDPGGRVAATVTGNGLQLCVCRLTASTEPVVYIHLTET